MIECEPLTWLIPEMMSMSYQLKTEKLACQRGDNVLFTDFSFSGTAAILCKSKGIMASAKLAYCAF